MEVSPAPIPAAAPARDPSLARRACAALLAASLLLSGCSFPMGVRSVRIGTREEKRALDRRVGADLRVEGGTVAVLRVSREDRTAVDTLAVYHRMAVRKDFTLLVLATVGVVTTLFIALLVAAANSDSDGGGGGGGGWGDWDD